VRSGHVEAVAPLRADPGPDRETALLATLALFAAALFAIRVGNATGPKAAELARAVLGH
jgi:hypothetical protein